MMKRIVTFAVLVCSVLGIVVASSLWGSASGKKMLHITGDGTATPVFGRNVELETEVSYTISFKYHAVTNGLSDSIALMVKAAFGSGAYTTYISSTDSTTLTFDVTNGHAWAVNQYTFTLPSDAYTSGTYGIGFQSRRKVTDIYVADFDIYKTEEPNTSLINNPELDQGLYGWRGNANSTVASEGAQTWGDDTLKVDVMEFDEVLFQNQVKDVYLSATGDDYADGTEDQPLQTLETAVGALKAGGTVHVLDQTEYTADSFSKVNGTVNIVGESDEASLTVSDNIVLGGNLGLDHLVLELDTEEKSIYTKGYQLVLGTNLTYSGNSPTVITGDDEMTAEKIELGNGTFNNIVIGGEEGSARITKLYGEGAEIQNLTVNTNQPDAIVQAYFEKTSFDNLKVENGVSYDTVEIINNKSDVEVTSTIYDDIWYIASEESGNSRVEFTDQAGNYNIHTEAGKLPIAVSADGTKVYTAESTGITSAYSVTQKNTNYSDYISYRGSLVNTYRRLVEDKELNIVYFGGSVTAGTGASDKEVYSWRALVGKWFEEQFPDADIHNISKALGESGTYLGAYRTQRDIIAEEPDLLFMEYAINDYYYGCTYEQAASQFETIVREVKQALPNCDVVTILVTDKYQATDALNGTLHTQAQAHEDISEAYGFPSIKVGLALYEELGETYSDVWGQYFSDIVHPLDAGYALYYKYINEYLENALLYTDYGTNCSTPYTMPAVVSENLFDGNRVVVSPNAELLARSEELGGSGFNHNTGYAAMDDYYGYYYAYQPADGDTDPTFVYEFNGTEVAMLTNAKTSANTEASGLYYYRVDDGDWQEGSHKSHNPSIIITGLEAGEHKIEIKPDFTGYAETESFRILVILSRDASMQTLQGGVSETDTTLVNHSLILPEGFYQVSYLETKTVATLGRPQKEGYVFVGWKNEEGNILSDDEVLDYSMILTAEFQEETSYYESLDPFVNEDIFADALDIVALRKGLVGTAEYSGHDVNGDTECDVVDLVALLKYLDSFGDNDVQEELLLPQEER